MASALTYFLLIYGICKLFTLISSNLNKYYTYYLAFFRSSYSVIFTPYLEIFTSINIITRRLAVAAVAPSMRFLYFAVSPYFFLSWRPSVAPTSAEIWPGLGDNKAKIWLLSFPSWLWKEGNPETISKLSSHLINCLLHTSSHFRFMRWARRWPMYTCRSR